MTMRMVLEPLAPGNAGILRTADRIWDFILYRGGEAAQGPNPRIRLQTERILSACDWQLCSRAIAAGLIYRWVQRHLVYVGDHLTYEELRDTDFLLDAIERTGKAFGDCDDFVILMGALLASIGIPFTIMVTSDREDGEFNHVWLLADTERGEVPMDAITREEFGWMVPAETITNAAEVTMPGA